MTRLNFVSVDERDHALETVTDYAEILFGDVVLVPFKDGEPDWENTTRDTLTKFAGHYTELDPDDLPRLAVLTDGFGRFIEDAENVSIVTLWRDGTPLIQQIDGEECGTALDIVMNAIIDDEPLQYRSANDNVEPGQPTPEPSAEPKTITASRFVLEDPALIPRRQWLFGGHYVRKLLSATFGAGGGGKSAHAVTETLAMVTGRGLLGDKPEKPLRVWYINLEDPQEENKRRFGAAAIHFNISNGDLDGRLFTDSGRDQEFVILKEDKRATRVIEPVVAGLIAEIAAHDIDVLIVDPFVSTHEVDENDNSKIQQAAAQWVRVAEKGNCAVELIHHVRKSTGELTVEDGRGGGALKDKARDVRIINGMSVAEAGSAGVQEMDRGDYFRIDSGKPNLKRRGGPSDWRRFVPVRLGNSSSKLVYNGDEIGVVEKWEWPSAASLVADVPQVTLDGIKSRIGGGNYRESEQAGDWAGYIVAEILGIDTDEKGEKQRVKRMLKAWIAAGHLVIEERLDGKRMPKKYIAPVLPHPEN